MQAGKPEESARRVVWHWVATSISALVVLAAFVAYLGVAAVRSGVDWGEPWTSWNPGRGRAGWLPFLSAAGVLVALGFSVHAHLRRRPSVDMWDLASAAMCLVLGLSAIAASAPISTAEWICYVLFAGIPMLMNGMNWWLGARSGGGNDGQQD